MILAAHIYYFVIFFLSSVLVSGLITPVVKNIALKLQIIDIPDKIRKFHTKPTPLLGGTAIFSSFFIILGILIYNSSVVWTHNYILPKYIIGIFLGGLILIIGGFLDDKYKLKYWQQLIFPCLAALIILMSGIDINFITNPLGGVYRLDNYKFEIFRWNEIPFYIVPLADILIFCWLLGIMYTTKLLDGVDGLVSGLGFVGGFIIFLLSIFPPVNQVGTAMLAIIFSGVCLGFFIFNFPPAKIFLGEGGSLFLGFILGVLSIIAGGKIATTVLILGLPIMDVVWIIIKRKIIDRSSLTKPDRKHLHFKLLDRGLTPRQVVMFFLFCSFVFGISALFLKTYGKLIAFIILLIIMFLTVYIIHKKTSFYK